LRDEAFGVKDPRVKPEDDDKVKPEDDVEDTLMM